MAHRIVWATAATVDVDCRPWTRVLHPIWEWNDGTLTGWIATSPRSPKAGHLVTKPLVSLTYWHPSHDTCTADCAATWEDSEEARAAGWRRFADGPAPVGYYPSIVPGWVSPTSPDFGILCLEPYRLRVMPGSVMMEGQGVSS